jgi:dephospho-CoA kinase
VTYLIAVAGYTGSGKTTSVQYLRDLCDGEVVYFGAAVLDYMRDRKLPETPETERIVRLKLREQNGPAAFAMLNAERVMRLLEDGVPVIVDAIFAPAEFELLRSHANRFPAHLVGITASFGTRCGRLKSRLSRPLSENEVAERDRTEVEELGTDKVLAAATRSIPNEGSLQDFYRSLEQLLEILSPKFSPSKKSKMYASE